MNRLWAIFEKKEMAPINLSAKSHIESNLVYSDELKLTSFSKPLQFTFKCFWCPKKSLPRIKYFKNCTILNVKTNSFLNYYRYKNWCNKCKTNQNQARNENLALCYRSLQYLKHDLKERKLSYKTFGCSNGFGISLVLFNHNMIRILILSPFLENYFHFKLISFNMEWNKEKTVVLKCRRWNEVNLSDSSRCKNRNPLSWIHMKGLYQAICSKRIHVFSQPIMCFLH